MSALHTDTEFSPVTGKPWLTAKLPLSCFLTPSLQWSRGEKQGWESLWLQIMTESKDRRKVPVTIVDRTDLALGNWLHLLTTDINVQLLNQILGNKSQEKETNISHVGKAPFIPLSQAFHHPKYLLSPFLYHCV